MASEETKLLKKSFDYLSNASLTVDPKLRECIVVVPTAYTHISRENIDEFVGLSLEELYLYMDDPYWRLLRRGIMISFWILLVAMLAAACIISIVEYKQQCIINTIESPFSAINHIDTFPMTNYTLFANAMASNSTAAEVYMITAPTVK